VATTLTPPTLRLDLTLKQGADASVMLTVIAADGQPITNPTGYSIRAQIREIPTGPVLFEWSSVPDPGEGTAVLTYTTGPPAVSLVTLTATGDQTALFTWRLAQWDCFMVNPLGQSTCLAEGVTRIKPYITH
jgi:hypothetical protein